MLAVVLLPLAIGIMLVNILKLRVPFECSENEFHPDILSNSTIKGGEFSSCHSAVTMTSREHIHYLPISAYKVSCENLVLYHEPFQINETIDFPEHVHFPVYDCSTSSCYFARGLSAQISVSVDAPGVGRISVCWFTNQSDYTHFLDKNNQFTPYEVGIMGDLTIKSLATPPTSM